jgi:hypothetical protein
MSDEPKLIRADEATVRLLDKMLQEFRCVSDQTNQSLQLIKQQIPEGIIDPKEITATTVAQTVVPPLDKRWFNISVVNDGPNSCYIVVNTEKSSTNPYLMRMHETFEVDLGVPKIVDALVWCASGSAALRIRGVR